MDMSGLKVFDASAPTHYAPKQRRYSVPILTVYARIANGTLLSLALALACWLQRQTTGFSTGELLLAGGLACAATALCLDRCGAYQLDRLSGTRPWAGMLFGGVFIGTVVFAGCLELLRNTRTNPVSDVGIRVAEWAAFAMFFLSCAHGWWVFLLSVRNGRAAMRRRVAVVGINELRREFVERAAQDSESDIQLVGLYTDSWSEEATAPNSEPLDGNLEDLAERSNRGDIDAIVLAVPLFETGRIDRIRNILQSATADIYVTADVAGLRFSSKDLHSIGRNSLISLRRRPLDDWQQLQKSIFDRLFGGMLLLVLSPALLLIGSLIRLDSQGPVLFRQSRLGFNNQPFTVYKFRTMYHHNDPAGLDGRHQARPSDPRITRIGRWLRKYSIDELPQLLNVMIGEMSLVGPRPHPLNTRVGNELFQDVVTNYAARHRVLPGITGWAQVSGWRGETVVREQIEQRVAHDLYYIDNWSLKFDMKILLLTLTREILSKHAF